MPTSQLWACDKSLLFARPKFTPDWLGLESESQTQVAGWCLPGLLLLPPYLHSSLFPFSIPLFLSPVFLLLPLNIFNGPACSLQFITGAAMQSVLLPSRFTWSSIHLNLQLWARFPLVLATQNLVCGPAAPAFPGSMLEMLRARPRPRHAETESSF